MPDFYALLRPFLFMMDAEKAHHLTISMLKNGLYPRCHHGADPSLRVRLWELDFPNPVGLAAGFDKQAEFMPAMFNFGFGAVEVGSITPQPQPGNPKPRLFRIPEAEAIINRFGFNSDGFDICVQRLTAYRQRVLTAPGVIGINIGKNKESPDAIADYCSGVQRFASLADYLTINISSPNTAGLRDLQARGQLAELVQEVMATRDALPKKPPVLVKVAPDLTPTQMDDIAEITLESGIDGLIVGNTTLARPTEIAAHLARESGGLSGKVLFNPSTEVLARMYQLTGGKIPLIGCGGISSGADAYAKIRAGASLVQLYSALVYHGPFLIPRINRELAYLLKRDGFKSVTEAVGVQ